MSFKPSKKTKLKIIDRTSDVLIAMGQTQEALRFLQKQQKIEPLKSIDEKNILIHFLTKSPDSILSPVWVIKLITG